tara:strand:+ start:15964 stop:16239 length:276 start_codon:yes stop_codon:yes gene_type:complete
MQVQGTPVLPLQFPVQAEHTWMYESDMPLPFPVRHSLLKAANQCHLNMDDLQMIGDMAEQYVFTHKEVTVNKCMLVRRAITHMLESQSRAK